MNGHVLVYATITPNKRESLIYCSYINFYRERLLIRANSS